MYQTTTHRIPRLEAHGISRHAGATQLLEEVSLRFDAGELVAIIGGSGAGKTTLLTTLAGVSRPSAGFVRADGHVLAAGGTSVVGYVPQDDIIHLDLPLDRTLMYAARLRLGKDASTADLWGAVERVLADLDLQQHASTAVRSLSGGQRKRASIAVELLSRPDILVLDEPTSGLDPGTAGEVVAVLRRLASHGTTVILTSHSPADVDTCDRVIVLAGGGKLAYDGPPSECPAYFGVESLAGVYSALSSWHITSFPTEADTTPVRLEETAPMTARATGRFRQFGTLVRRNGDLMARNRLTLAILLGSPALVIAMLATLFRPGTFDGDPSNVVAGIQMVYWIAFAGFFFGLTYGLLQIVTEAPIFRRERSWGLSTTAYVASKIAILAPLLLAIDVALLTVLRLFDRLPAADLDVWAALGGTFLLDAFAGLTFGLLASALVTNASQATLALPMLCFPQVLFAGAMVPIDAMTGFGEAISSTMSNRWAFEALGRLLDLGTAFGAEVGVLADWEQSLTGSAHAPVLGLAGIAVVCTLATIAVLGRAQPR